MWRTAPANLTLKKNEVHLWRAELDRDVQPFASILSADETLRAERFYFEQHRQRFIVGRGILRNILSRYLAIEPAQLQFEYGSRGKPELSQVFSGAKLQFNLSHSQGLALYGFTCDRRIGVDLEYLRPVPDAQKIAQRFFSDSESASISALPPSEQQKAFYRGWTGKEAYLKATGEGLAGLEQVEVSPFPDELRLIRIGEDVQAASRWTLLSLSPACGYLATVAVEGHDWQMSGWQA